MKFSALLFPAILLFFASSCGNGNSDENQTKKEAKGNKVYGGCLKVAENEPIQSLYPASITDVTSAFVATQIYDGLVKFNTASLKIEPAIAEKWEIDPSGKVYRFFLRKGVRFQDDACFSGGKGREVNAYDFKYSFELLCSAGKENENFTSTFKDRVLGANEFYAESKAGKKPSLAGLRIIEDYILEIELERPSSVFLGILAQPVCAVIPKESISSYGLNSHVGAGAFYYDKASHKNLITLRKNENYYLQDSVGNILPFLDSVQIHIVATKEQELALFKDQKLDMIISLPSQAVKEMVEAQIQDFQSKPPKYLLDNSAEMITQYYTFNTTRTPFDNPKVRKAFNYAIDRQKIIDEVLNGQAYGPGIKGITPPTFKNLGYDITQISGYEFNPVLAKKLLAEAGFPNGRAFPPVRIVLNSGGAKNSNVVVEIQKQLLENLNVNIDFDVVPYKQKLEEAMYGKSDIIRDAWVADYPSPETFLNLFYGKHVPEKAEDPSFPNTSRFRNEIYDKYFTKGKNTSDLDSANHYFAIAEQALMDEAPIMVLWYEGNYRITHSYVKNAHTNPMRYRNFSDVFIKKEVQTAQKSAEKS